MNRRDSTRNDLEQMFKKKGCALCHWSTKRPSIFSIASCTKASMTPKFGKGREPRSGFCNRHAWQMRHIGGNALGTAFLHGPRSANGRSGWTILGGTKMEEHTSRNIVKRLRRRIKPLHHASAARQQAEVEKRHIETFLAALVEADFRRLVRGSGGFMYTYHFSAASRAAKDPQALKMLIEIQGEINRGLLGELDEFIRKSDYRFVAEGFGSEGDSWLRAIERLSGAEDFGTLDFSPFLDGLLSEMSPGPYSAAQR